MKDCFGTLNNCKTVILEGKTKESYNPHVLFCVDFVIVVVFVLFWRCATDCGTARESCRRAGRFYWEEKVEIRFQIWRQLDFVGQNTADEGAALRKTSRNQYIGAFFSLFLNTKTQVNRVKCPDAGWRILRKIKLELFQQCRQGWWIFKFYPAEMQWLQWTQGNIQHRA